MASKRISDLTSLAQASLATGDLLPIVDISDTVANQNKKITATALVLGALALSTNNLVVGGAGPHSIGGAATQDVQFWIQGTHAGTTNVSGLAFTSTLTAPANGAGYGLNIAPTINKASSGTHADFAGVILTAPTIGAGAATLTNATTLKIVGAPSTGTNQRALWVAAGATLFEGTTTIGSGGTGTGSGIAAINGGSGGAGGAYISFQRNSASTSSIGTHAAVLGSGTASDLTLYEVGTGGIRFYVNGAEQVRITSTASATRYITLTGSNGGSPAIGTSGGDLNLAPATGIVLTTASGNTAIYGPNTAASDQVFFAGSNNATSGSGYFAATGSSHAQAGNVWINAGTNGIIWGQIAGNEKWRTTNAGYFKASNDGTYISAVGPYHEARQTNGTDYITRFTCTHAITPNGINIFYTAAAPNGTGNNFIRGEDNVGTKFEFRSNGGIANFSANNVNLSDRASKFGLKVYTADEMEVVSAAFDKVDFGIWKYKDQTHDDWNHGPTVQGVEEAFKGVKVGGRKVLDSLVDMFDEKRKLKGLVTEDFKNLAIAALLHRTRKLEARLAAAGL